MTKTATTPDSNDEAAGFFELSAWLAEREPRFAVVPPASDGRPLLTLAAQCGPDASNTCLWLLKHGAVCNGVGASFDPPLHEAIKMRLTSVVEAMLAPEHGVDLLARDANGSQPLHLAARHGLFDAAMRIAWAVVSAWPGFGCRILTVSGRSCGALWGNMFWKSGAVLDI